MKDEILTYWEMCSRQGMSLQRGMYFRTPPTHGIILMSRRSNAPYADEMSTDGTLLVYEGHDVLRTEDTPNPKIVDQPRVTRDDKLTENGKFAAWVDDYKKGSVLPAVFRVYEKMRPGIWTDRGLYTLEEYDYLIENIRRVFKFWLEQSEFDSSGPYEATNVQAGPRRQIPSWIKQLVYKRDKGRCVLCGATDQLHFDHDFPFSKGGTSLVPENVRILCARHNLQKSARIE